jgi:hypothetical protein
MPDLNRGSAQDRAKAVRDEKHETAYKAESTDTYGNVVREAVQKVGNSQQGPDRAEEVNRKLERDAADEGGEPTLDELSALGCSPLLG